MSMSTDSGQVAVKVTDGIGDPLTGATVAIGNNGSYSIPQLVDLSGVATFELPQGNYDAQVVLSGYAPKVRPFEITAGQTTKVHVAFDGANDKP
ncbi:MAG TPA: carboxypeptidase-like regulatory domain-containing protein [Tahibacter sp.]|nr:carboxypeptidase-like regulatory domain-containing protein [Tahibacter sp.]